MQRVSIGLTATLTLMLFGAAAAAERPPARAGRFDQLAACRNENDPGRRLACYDAQVGQLIDAESRRDIVVIDREQVRQTRRTLFGLSLPNLAIFGDRAKSEDTEEIQQVEGVVMATHMDQDGRWLFRLEDGASWQQIDSNPLAFSPKRGDKVVIKRASLGSFMLRLNGMPGIRARRVN